MPKKIDQNLIERRKEAKRRSPDATYRDLAKLFNISEASVRKALGVGIYGAEGQRKERSAPTLCTSAHYALRPSGRWRYTATPEIDAARLMKKYIAYVAGNGYFEEVDDIQEKLTSAYGGLTMLTGLGMEDGGNGETVHILTALDVPGVGPEPFEREVARLAELLGQESWLFEAQEVEAELRYTSRGEARRAA